MVGTMTRAPMNAEQMAYHREQRNNAIETHLKRTHSECAQATRSVTVMAKSYIGLTRAEIAKICTRIVHMRIVHVSVVSVADKDLFSALRGTLTVQTPVGTSVIFFAIVGQRVARTVFAKTSKHDVAMAFVVFLRVVLAVRIVAAL